jgi:long-chain fatty acid transport protein
MRKLATALMVLTTASVAHAGGYFTARFGGTDGNVTTDQVCAAYYNPAGLALAHGTRVSVEGDLAYRTASYERDPASVSNLLQPGDTGPGTPVADLDANTGTGKLSNLIVSPFAGVATDFGVKNLGVALTFSVPFGGQAKWDRDRRWAGNTTYPGAVDGAQRWGNIEGDIRSLYFTAAGAYLFAPIHLSVGLGVNVIVSSVDTLKARNPTGTDDLVSQPSGSLIEGRSRVEASGTTFSLAGGLMWMPIPALRVGLAYQGQPGFGKHHLDGTLENQFSGGARSRGDIEFEQDLPDITTLGASYQVSPPLRLDASVSLQRWSVFKDQCVLDKTMAGRSCDIDASGNLTAGSAGVVAVIPRFWKNSYDFNVGAHYELDPRWTLGAALTVSTSAVTDRGYDAAFIDMLKFIPVVGASWKISDLVTIVGNVSQVIYLTRDVPVEAAWAGPSKTPSQAGTYKQAVSLFQLEAQLHF